MSESTAERPVPTIQPRRLSFPAPPDLAQHWRASNPLITGFFYALSATFPDGERFFIDSVRHYRERVGSPALREQIRGFIGQEAHHGRAHEDYNAELEKLGLPMARVAGSVRRLLGFVQRRFSPARQLAITAALEHLTATLAGQVLEKKRVLAPLDGQLRQMLVWHAVEEIEHKSVAFDVYREQVASEALRRRAGAIALTLFFLRISYYQITLLRGARRWPSARHWAEAAVFFWGRDDVLRRSAGELLRYFRRGFHPSHIDQRALIEGWEQRHPDVAALQY